MLEPSVQGQLGSAVPAPGADAATAAELEALQRPAFASIKSWRKALLLLLAVAAAPAMVAWWAGMVWGLVALARLFH